ncbi:hypothetical protein [Jiulongibacter sediminis]|uniref:hypothetical protein n=1 Tax=Jiulongibacter sediminis TaxID=1605367 RepID=UPI0026F32A4E|nr:hypothetical protein [Jiulongibacter sediminis]
MAIVSLNRIRKYNPDYSSVIAPIQTGLKIEILNAAGTEVLYEYIYPIGTEDIDLEIDSGSYVFKLTVLDTIISGNMSFQLVDEVPAQFLFNSGSVLNEGNKVYTSPSVSVSSNFNNLKIFQSSSFVSEASAAAFAVNYALGICSGVDPNKTRRATFSFENYDTPLEFSLDEQNWVIFNPNGFYRDADVGTTVTYYFRDNNGNTDDVTITFDDCAVAPPAAPTLSDNAILTSETVDISFVGGPGTIKVYEGNTLRQTITNAVSPYTFQPTNLNNGQYTFSFSNANGESAKSAVLTVNSSSGGGFCSLSHLDEVLTWNTNEGDFDNVAIKFSNTGTKPYNGQVVSYQPLKFLIRGKNQVNRDDVVLAAGLTTSVKDCLAGEETGLGGLIEPTGFPMPPGYERVGNVYQPIDSAPSENVVKRIRVNVSNFCTASAGTVQIGITASYASEPPASSEVTEWLDGLEADVVVQNGAYPWVFVRDKADPTNVSNATRTLE